MGKERHDSSLLEDTKERLIGRGIVVDPHLRGFTDLPGRSAGRFGGGSQSRFGEHQPTGGGTGKLIQRYKHRVRSPGGVSYLAQVYGRLRPDGNWEGWLEFRLENAVGTVLRTDRETTQPDEVTLAYWASGLEPVYLEGALLRAIRAKSQPARVEQSS